MDLDLVQGILLTVMFSGSLVYLAKHAMLKDSQREYELEFIERHEHIIERMLQVDARATPTNFIPLTFPQRETQHLLDLCKRPWSKWTPHYYLNTRHLETYQPSVQIHYLDFRTVSAPYGPIGVEVIRCGDDHALMEAGDGIMGYVLERFEYERDPADVREIFFINTKFNYGSKIGLPRESDKERHQFPSTESASDASSIQRVYRRRRRIDT